MRLLVGVAALALAGCPSKKDRARNFEATYEKYLAFTDEICACKDKACADHVQERMTTWSVQMAKEAGHDNTPPSEKQIEKLTEAGTRYAECLTKLMTDAASAVAEADVPGPASKLDVDSLVRQARDWVRSTRAQLSLHSIVVSYVDAEGALDDQHGTLQVLFGRSHRDDPKRRTGTPVAAPRDVHIAHVFPDNCPMMVEQ